MNRKESKPIDSRFSGRIALANGLSRPFGEVSQGPTGYVRTVNAKFLIQVQADAVIRVPWRGDDPTRPSRDRSARLSGKLKVEVFAKGDCDVEIAPAFSTTQLPERRLLAFRGHEPDAFLLRLLGQAWCGSDGW